VRLRRRADEREVRKLEQEQVRRRIDATQRAIELDGTRRGRSLRALRDDDLERVARADVLDRAANAALVLVLVGVAPQLAGYAVTARNLRLRAREDLRRVRRIAAERLRDPARVVEPDEQLGHDEEALRERRAVLGPRHGRFERRDRVVAEVADDRLAEPLRLVHVDEPRPVPDERVPPEPALLHRLEEERGDTFLADAEIRAERCHQVDGNLSCGCDRHVVTDSLRNEKDPPVRKVWVERIGWRTVSECAGSRPALAAATTSSGGNGGASAQA
jgi:hypothetical protein